ncbi:MAG: peptide MFS transporter [Cytophagaceae bacterium]|nr:peptide MFS transporter [Cytophagaceae bacterium]MDW8457250.1 peptide MFS transporter [Cytophagaceae bacterium]
MNTGWNVLIVAWLFVGIWISFVIYNQRRYHPKALFYLFFTEVWERFSYYGMRALFTLYLVKQLMYSDERAGALYGAYVALVYATPVLGGFLAEKYLGARNSIMLGAILMAIGHVLMSIEQEWILYGALGFLIMGNGFFKPNISTLVGKFYAEGDVRRDNAFTIFYMGVNTGAFLTPLTCGFIGETYGWHYGFGLAGLGMIIGLLIFYTGNKKNIYLDKGLPPANINYIQLTNSLKIDAPKVIYAGAFLMVPLLALLLNYNSVSKYILYTVGISMLIYLFVLAQKEDRVQRQKLYVVLLLFFFTVMFWTFFELAGSAITLFTERNVNRVLQIENLDVSIEIKSSQFQGINPFFIIVLAPLFSYLWVRFSKISIPQKFGSALIQLGLGFYVLYLSVNFADAKGLVPMSFLVVAYLLHTTGELCISPIGLSLVTKLSPKTIVAFVMGIWMLSSSFAGLIGAEITRATSLPREEGVQPPPIQSLYVYTSVFEVIAYVAIVAGIIIFAMNSLIRKWMHDVQ